MERGLTMEVLSHSRDTVSAHEAADKMQSSGKAAYHKARVIGFIGEHQGMTAGEIGLLTDLGHIAAQRRISDLISDGLIEYRGRRKCSVKGSNMSTIYLTMYGANVMNARYRKNVGWFK